MSEDAPKKEAGRPRIEFDLKRVETLGIIHAPYSLIAKDFGVSDSTIDDRMQNDPDFRAAYARGQRRTNEQLRSKQIQVALNGNVRMLIWLGKQNLGQMEPRDRFALEEIEALKERLAKLEKAGANGKANGDARN